MLGSLGSLSCVPLTKTQLEDWAKMPFWEVYEAMLLSMGMDPAEQSMENPQDEAICKKNAKELFDRLRRCKREVLSGHFQKILARIDGYDFHPVEFSKWATANFSSFPPELYQAVLQHSSAKGLGDSLKPFKEAEPLSDTACMQAPETNHSTDISAGDMATEKCSEAYEQELKMQAMDDAERIIESGRKKKCTKENRHALNASGPRPHIKYAKVQAASCALLNIRKGCTCINHDLEGVVFNEICEEVQSQYPNIKDVMLKDYIKEAVNLAMKADGAAITRIVRLKGHWDNKWLKIKCTLLGHQ